MLENAGRKAFYVVVALLVALGLLFAKDQPFRLGLDLKGGTRLVYRIDFDKAIEGGLINPNEDRTQLLNDTITIIRNRVDPQGVLEPVIRAEGSDRIVIELPGTFDLEGEQVTAELQTPLGNGLGGAVELTGDQVTSFPDGGGLIQIGDEIVRYQSRHGRTLELGDSKSRAQRGTSDQDHPAGATVQLVSDDAIRARIESLGSLAFRIVATAADFTELGTDLPSERKKLDDWAAENPELPIVAFNRVEGEAGPNPAIEWYPQIYVPGTTPESELARARPVLRPETPEDDFRGEDLAKVYPSQDQQGYPAVGFEMRVERRGDFGDFTEKNTKRQMAIVLNDEISSAPVIENRLPGGGIIQGRFTPEEVRDLMTVLRSGSLTIAPILEYEEIVGPTLGADYVKRGYISGLVALVLVLGFMVVYYRLLGIFAAISLVVSFVLLLGGLSFLDATLTLPGIAGIILTVGMAVDANILIFDRIREEADKGRNAKQAAKTGFEKALSAILDANITTFLTAVILYRIGTGPVRGFAVTLMIGIVTSVFCALLVTRLFVHRTLDKGTKHFNVGTWMVTASYDFLSKSKLAIGASTLAVVAGMALFFSLPGDEKLGIDFTGGAEVHLRTESAQSIETMRQRVAAIGGTIGESAEVKPILNSAQESGAYTDFRAIFKTLGGGQRDFEGELKAALGDLLLSDGVQVGLEGEGATQTARVTLIFEEPHPTSDIEGVLGQAGLNAVTVEQAQRANSYVGTGQASAGQTATDVAIQVKTAFRGASDSDGNAYRLATPIPSSSLVGPQVVGELRDKALLALAISLFVTVMYIRVRFAEYSFGFAAVIAVLHDVLITLGALTLVNWLGILNGEISLPMIAAFLTIVGYSLNDTIVIFDRVRENLPRSKGTLAEVLNLSINQTLSRTVLTSLTTFLAVLCLFVFNYGTGNVLESFSFAMMVGVLTGTYSTIFIANPLFLWLENRSLRKQGERGAKTKVPATA